jgi:hypothetical protein
MEALDTIAHLKEFGFARLDAVLSEDQCDRLAGALDEIVVRRRQAGTMYQAGEQAVVYDPSVECPELFLPAISLPSVLEPVEALVGSDCILGGFAGSKSGPVTAGAAGPHIDGNLAVQDVDDTQDVQVAICLDPFTLTNGATRVWPMSHRSGTRIQKSESRHHLPPPLILEAPKGAALFFLGQTWHQVGANTDGSRRWGLFLTYRRWWIKPMFDFTRCGAATYQRLTVTQKRLFGFSSRPPAFSEGRIKTLTKPEELPVEYHKALAIQADEAQR